MKNTARFFLVLAAAIMVAYVGIAYATGSFTWSKAPIVRAAVSNWNTGWVDISEATGPATASMTGHSSIMSLRARYGANSPVKNLTTVTCTASATHVYTTRAAYGQVQINYSAIQRRTTTTRQQKGDLVYY